MSVGYIIFIMIYPLPVALVTLVAIAALMSKRVAYFCYITGWSDVMIYLMLAWVPLGNWYAFMMMLTGEPLGTRNFKPEHFNHEDK